MILGLIVLRLLLVVLVVVLLVVFHHLRIVVVILLVVLLVVLVLIVLVHGQARVVLLRGGVVRAATAAAAGRWTETEVLFAPVAFDDVVVDFIAVALADRPGGRFVGRVVDESVRFVREHFDAVDAAELFEMATDEFFGEILGDTGDVDVRVGEWGFFVDEFVRAGSVLFELFFIGAVSRGPVAFDGAIVEPGFVHARDCIFGILAIRERQKSKSLRLAVRIADDFNVDDRSELRECIFQHLFIDIQTDIADEDLYGFTIVDFYVGDIGGGVLRTRRPIHFQLMTP